MDAIVRLRDVYVSYNGNQALQPVSLDIYQNKVTAIMGPSGCGKSTLLRAINRMNELNPDARTYGKVLYNGTDIYADLDVHEVRRCIGMVFQKSNPFPKSIYDNVAFGPRIHKYEDVGKIVEESLKKAALWDEVKDRLGENAYKLSGGQQQRLCIARTLAVNPDVILMDEPCSSLDPTSTRKIEDLIQELAKDRTIILVTHNIQQAARVAEWIAFMYFDGKMGYLHHFGDSHDTFVNPRDKVLEKYVEGKFDKIVSERAV